MRRLLGRLDPVALRGAWSAFMWSRLLVIGLGIYVWLRIPPHLQYVRGFQTENGRELAHAFDGWPAGGVLRALFEPYAIYDAVAYVTIAQDGYKTGDDLELPSDVRATFFPLYPMAARVGSLFLDSTAAVLVAAVGISLIALLGALYLLHRLTALELGVSVSKPVLFLLVFFPSAFVLGAPYTESLFLLLTVGGFYAARTGHWAVAGMAAAGATATRNSGILLLLPLVVMYLWGPRGDRTAVDRVRAGTSWRERLRPRYRLRRDFAWFLLSPAVFGAYMLYLEWQVGDALAWTHGQTWFYRETTTPFTGLARAFDAAWHALQADPQGQFYDFGSLNVLNLAFFLLAVAVAVGVFRRLPIAYGLYIVPALILPLSAPWENQPLAAYVRYLLPLFPLFMWLGWWCERRGITERVVAVFAAVMGVLAVQFANGFFTL